MQNRIFIIEDEKHISGLIEYNLKNAGFNCLVSHSGENALNTIKSTKIDLIILDVMLPKINGLDLCRQIKNDKMLSLIPIIMLTAKGEEIDRITGLESGADDYIVKPFSTRELVLRVKAILKRSSKKATNEKSDVLKAGNIEMNISKHKVTISKKEIQLTQMEFDLLALLIKRQGRVQSRDQLLSDIWNITSDITSRTVDTHIKRLRKKMGKAGNLIETVRGLGYRFSEE